MSNLSMKYQNFNKGIQRIEEAANKFDYDEAIVRDAVIQRFEFTLEICWRMLRIYLLDQGITNIYSPKTVLREAYSMELISDEKLWLDMVEDRNLTSHIYDEEVSIEIAHRIVENYLIMFKKLSDKLKNEIS